MISGTRLYVLSLGLRFPVSFVTCTKNSLVDVDGAPCPPTEYVRRNAAFGWWLLVLTCDVAL